MTILARILRTKKAEVACRRAQRPPSELRARLRDAPPPRDFAAALAGPEVALIAEVKRASPSRGPLRPDLDPADLAVRYARAGAAALSVLTDWPFFRGSAADLRRARQAVPLPVLRKDFLLDPYQVLEARVWGADAVLLIAAALSPDRLRELLEATWSLGMAALVEVHDEGELEVALAAGARIVGVNHRDLRTFQVDLSRSARLLPRLPADVLGVAESGIAAPADVRRVAAAGARAVLVGEALVRAPDPEAAARALATAGRAPARREVGR